MTASLPPDSRLCARERQLIAQIARRFYLEDESKVAIAKDLGLSRFKVARLLAAGRADGLIRIEILEPTTDLPTFSKPLAEHLQLQDARVIDSFGNRSQVRSQLGAMGAQYLTDVLRGGETVGISWGRTVYEVARHISNIPSVTAVQLSGSIRDLSPQNPVEQLRSCIESAGGSVHPIYDPLYLGENTERQRRMQGLTYILGLFDHLSVAVLSVGSWQPPTTQLRALFPPAIRDRLDRLKPAAELGGIWLDTDGRVIGPEITRQCITVATHHLLATPRVVAVAGGVEKAEALAACARSGLITSLITDRITAETLLTLPRVTRHVLTRH